MNADTPILINLSNDLWIALHGSVGSPTSIQSNLSDSVDTPESSAAMSAVESMVLAQFTQGVDVRSAAYYEALQTTIDAILNYYGD